MSYGRPVLLWVIIVPRGLDKLEPAILLERLAPVVRLLESASPSSSRLSDLEVAIYCLEPGHVKILATALRQWRWSASAEATKAIATIIWRRFELPDGGIDAARLRCRRLSTGQAYGRQAKRCSALVTELPSNWAKASPSHQNADQNPRGPHSAALSADDPDAETLAKEDAIAAATNINAISCARYPSADGVDGDFVAAASFVSNLLANPSPEMLEVKSWPCLLQPGSFAIQRPSLQSAAAELKHVNVCEEPKGAPAMACKLRSYLKMHRKAVDALSSSGAGGHGKAKGGNRMLVYLCSPMVFCGGHGDRVNGLTTAFLLSILTDRAFFIDAAQPVPLASILRPRQQPGKPGTPYIDWRMHGTVTGARVYNYNDQFADYTAELDLLLADPSDVIVLVANQRKLTHLLLQPALASRCAEYGIQSEGLAKDLFHLLFEPSIALADEISGMLAPLARDPVRSETDGRMSSLRPWVLPSPKRPSGLPPLIALHFRSGDQSPTRWQDPPRHSLDSLAELLACAREVEQRLHLPGETLWLLSADTTAAFSDVEVSRYMADGKLKPLAAHSEPIHIDRSALDLTLPGLIPTWAEWFAFGTANAVILSASGFGVTAAEVGGVPHAFYFEGCVEADLSLP
eukprot:TRINITY_DN25533_c0_g1_i1.p1 TRINITY_DN25533_c0_g1~~TRINITY_DN25533_c0_g1_i1.p1  ORF type:complete len:710 (-),score=87.62 TRINITY_DN25533_c0_g1_i1:74-1966(-)